MSAEEDRTARARIRDAALSRFAIDGFGATVRQIAADAGVSPALVLHHFGSKDGLRRVCDEQVRQVMLRAKSGMYTDPPEQRPASVLALLADAESLGLPTAYLLRAFQAGGELARELAASMVELTEQMMAEGVAAGTLRASRDEGARARFLVLLSMGALVVDQALNPSDPADPGAMVRDYVARYALPSAEVFTEGLIVDRTVLDTLLSVAEPVENSGPNGSEPNDLQPSYPIPPAQTPHEAGSAAADPGRKAP